MKTAILTVVLACGWTSAGKAQKSAAIMAKVAANTDAAVDARRQFVYHQKIRTAAIRTDGNVSRREMREYAVVPQKDSTEKTLAAFSGEYRQGRRMIPYAKPGVKDKGDESDQRNVQSLTDELVNAPGARDGIPHDLFPLGGDDLKYYAFTLKGELEVDGRRAFDVLFEPASLRGMCVNVGSTVRIELNLGSGSGADEKGICRQWQGEVWVDAEEFQPLRIVTKMAKGVPWGVRVFFGTNVRQFGFSLEYIRVAPNVWFPKSYGAEFGIDVLWGYKRNITLSMENSDFRKTDASSTIRFEP